MQDIVIYHLKKSRPNGDLFSFGRLFVILWSNRGIRFCNTDHIRRSQRALACPAVCRNGCSRCTSGYPVLSRCIFGREGRVSKDCRPKAIIIEIALLDGRIAQSKQTAFFSAAAEAHRPFPEETIRRRSRWFQPQGLSKEFGGGHMLGNDTGTAVVGGISCHPRPALPRDSIKKLAGFQAFAQTNRLFRIDNEAVRSCSVLVRPAFHHIR